MPEKDTNSDAESERVKKWREERAKVAAEEKAERVRQHKEQRLQEIALEKKERLEKTKSLLPDQSKLDQVRNRIEERIRNNKRVLQRSIIIFILLPTLFVGAYTGWVAVPLFEARSVMTITSADSRDEPSLGGVLSGALGGGGQGLAKAYMADEYINSRTMMDYLERDLSLISRLSSSEIDPLFRLRDIPSLGISRTSQFSRYVESSIDIQSGLMTLYVRALSPEDAHEISESILFLTAEHINSLSTRLFEERIVQTEMGVEGAQEELVSAQRNLTQLQVASGEADPSARIATIYATIGQLETELEKMRTEFAELEVSGQSDSFQTGRLTDLIVVQQQRIIDFRNQLFTSDDGTRPLNELLLEHEMARLRMRIAEEALTASLAELSRARTDAELGRSQFQVVVPPNASDISTYPNVFRAMLLALVTTSAIFVLSQILRTGREV